MSLPIFSLVRCTRCAQCFTCVTDGFYYLDTEGSKLKKHWNSGNRECPRCKSVLQENEWKGAIQKTYGTEYDIDKNGFPDFTRLISGEYNQNTDYFKFPEGKFVRCCRGL